jgi:WD40 repeat protein
MCIRTLNGHDGSFMSRMGDRGSVQGIVYSPQGDLIASGGDDKRVKMWDVETGECRHIWIGHTEEVLGVIYSPSGTQIASRSFDSTVRIWDVEKGICLHIMEGHTTLVSGIAYSPRGD